MAGILCLLIVLLVLLWFPENIVLWMYMQHEHEPFHKYPNHLNLEWKESPSSKFTVLKTVLFNYTQWRIQDFPEEGATTLQGGRQHTILPNFPKNCMKLKEFGPPGGASKILLCRSATDTLWQYPVVPEIILSKIFEVVKLALIPLHQVYHSL